jgi:serine/threonine-protein kinase HipA
VADFQYEPNYLINPKAFPILLTMPLRHASYSFSCAGDGVPGFIDELLPGKWGLQILTRRLFNDGIDHNPTIADFLSHPSSCRIGCFVCTEDDAMPAPPSDGVHLNDAAAVSKAAVRVAAQHGSQYDVDLLEKAGATGIKGAMPKFLCFDDNHFWLAKLASGRENYDVLLAEHTAMTIAREAGLNAPLTRLETMADQRVLLVERFDRVAGARKHIVSFSALLKDPHSQQDRMSSSYDVIAGLIRRYSQSPVEDQYQLLGQMLLNAALRNTDDHLGNLSLLIGQRGIRLSPAYDIVPTNESGDFHQLLWNFQNRLPSLSQAGEAAGLWGLDRNLADELGERLAHSICRHAGDLKKAGIII